MPDKRFARPPSRRLAGKRAFSAVFEDGLRESRGPLRFVARPNGLDYLRTGLAVPRGVGTAVRRNRIKRLLRESFRLLQHDLPGGYDLVTVVRPHSPLTLADYMKLVTAAMEKLHRKYSER